MIMYVLNVILLNIWLIWLLFMVWVMKLVLLKKESLLILYYGIWFFLVLNLNLCLKVVWLFVFKWGIWMFLFWCLSLCLWGRCMFYMVKWIVIFLLYLCFRLVLKMVYLKSLGLKKWFFLYGIFVSWVSLIWSWMMWCWIYKLIWKFIRCLLMEKSWYVSLLVMFCLDSVIFYFNLFLVGFLLVYLYFCC